MPNYAGRDRAYRRPERARDEAVKTDAATAALTAQVIVCILLLLCAVVMKKTDEAGYIRFKEQYRIMLSDPTQMDKAVEWISGFGGFFSKLKKPESEIQAGPEMDIDEPVDEPEPAMEFQYDYLDAHASAYSSPEAIAVPAGSIFPSAYPGTKIKPPITGVITSGFAYRKHPLTDKTDYHTGIDIAAEEGKPILAALSGRVEEVGWSQIYGNYIVLRHTPELKTSYSHCSEIIAEEDMLVRQGERIALVGQTGSATGPHLHFSVIQDGEYTDPGRILNDYIRQVRQ